jgi:hypothetical protein
VSPNEYLERCGVADDGDRTEIITIVFWKRGLLDGDRILARHLLPIQLEDIGVEHAKFFSVVCIRRAVPGTHDIHEIGDWSWDYDRARGSRWSGGRRRVLHDRLCFLWTARETTRTKQAHLIRCRRPDYWQTIVQAVGIDVSLHTWLL